MNLFTKIIEGIFGGALVYIMSSAFLTAMITGTSTTDTLIKTYVPWAIVLAIFAYILGMVGKSMNQ
jgi:hypothetical protein